MVKRGIGKTKAKAIAKSYIKNKFNGTKTGLDVYNTTNPNSAKRMISKALKLPEVQNAIQQELAEAGLTKEYLNKTMYDAIEINKHGKPSQAVLAQLIIQGQKIYNYLPKDTKTVTKEVRKVYLDKNYQEIKSELEASLSVTQELLNDL